MSGEKKKKKENHNKESYPIFIACRTTCIVPHHFWDRRNTAIILSSAFQISLHYPDRTYTHIGMSDTEEKKKKKRRKNNEMKEIGW